MIIARTLAEKLGGSLRLTWSQVGLGPKLRLELPCGWHETEAASAGAGEEFSDDFLRDYRVLAAVITEQTKIHEKVFRIAY